MMSVKGKDIRILIVASLSRSQPVSAIVENGLNLNFKSKVGADRGRNAKDGERVHNLLNTWIS